MKTYLRILLATWLAILGCQPVLADAVIFSGSDVKTLKPNIDLFGQSKILSGTVDPTSSATSAPIGSVYLNSTNGNVYRKLDAGSTTNWDLVGSGSAGINNLLTNPTWNAVSTSWTASGGTYARTTTAAQIASGAGAGSWDSGSAAQTLTSSAVAIPAGAYGAGGVASCKFKAASGTATHKIQAYDGTNVLAEATITSDTALYPRTYLNFPFPTSGNIQLRIVSVASDEVALYMDDCYLGISEGYNSSAIAQSTLWAKATWAPTASCAWSSTQNVAFANFAADTDCPNPTVVGYGTAAGTKIPGFTITSLPIGNYLIVYTGAPYGTAGTNTNGYLRISDGTNVSNTCLAWSGGLIAGTGGCTFSFKVSAAASNVTLQLQTMTSGSGGTPTLNLFGEGTATQAGGANEIAIYRFPDANDSAINISENRQPTIQKFTATGTYTTPQGISHIRIRGCGGGSGGGGSGTGGSGGGGAIGGNTSFGSLGTGNGGPAQGNAYTPTLGGTSSITSPAFGSNGTGNGGQGAGQAASANTPYIAGGQGGAGLFQGQGAGIIIAAGVAPAANSCAGGTGAGTNGVNSSLAGAGGSAGGWFDIEINNPAASYAVTIGAGGTAGTAGTSGFAGTAGSGGYIEVWEFYRANTNVVMNTLRGTATNDSAVAGYLGEYISSTVAFGSAVSLTTTVVANVTSISLTPGDWDVSGMVGYSVTGTLTTFIAGPSTTSAALPSESNAVELTTSTTGNVRAPFPTTRMSVASTTTVYLVAQGFFTGTVAAFGRISARRVR